MEMTIDFVKTQSFPENLVCAFSADGLTAYGLSLINRGRKAARTTLRNATNVDGLSEP